MHMQQSQAVKLSPLPLVRTNSFSRTTLNKATGNRKKEPTFLWQPQEVSSPRNTNKKDRGSKKGVLSTVRGLQLPPRILRRRWVPRRRLVLAPVPQQDHMPHGSSTKVPPIARPACFPRLVVMRQTQVDVYECYDCSSVVNNNNNHNDDAATIETVSMMSHDTTTIMEDDLTYWWSSTDDSTDQDTTVKSLFQNGTMDLIYSQSEQDQEWNSEDDLSTVRGLAYLSSSSSSDDDSY